MGEVEVFLALLICAMHQQPIDNLMASGQYQNNWSRAYLTSHGQRNPFSLAAIYRVYNKLAAQSSYLAQDSPSAVELQLQEMRVPHERGYRLDKVSSSQSSRVDVVHREASNLGTNNLAPLGW